MAACSASTMPMQTWQIPVVIATIPTKDFLTQCKHNGTNKQVAQAIGSGTASYFAQILAQFEDFYTTVEKTGEDVNNPFVNIFNGRLRWQPNSKRLLELLEDYSRPENVPFLLEFAHKKLHKGPKVIDGLI